MALITAVASHVAKIQPTNQLHQHSQLPDQGPTRFWTQDRNRCQLEFQSHVVPKTVFQATKLGNLLTKWPFCLSLWIMIWYINFMAWRQRIISLVCFANNVIHPWPLVMPIFNREMPPDFTPAICLRHNFVHISILENREDKSIGQSFQNIVLDSHAYFREKLSLALTAQPQNPKLSWILQQIFQNGGRPTCTRMLGGKHTRY